MNKLLAAFAEFFRENSEHWIERFQYKEAGPQLLLQAFLQRIVNSGGCIEREYGLDRLRTDLLVLWPHPDGVQKAVIELKLLRRSLEQTIAEGLEQTWSYMGRCGADEGHLVIFDRREGKSWQGRIFRRQESYHGEPIAVWGMRGRSCSEASIPSVSFLIAAGGVAPPRKIPDIPASARLASDNHGSPTVIRHSRRPARSAIFAA